MSLDFGASYPEKHYPLLDKKHDIRILLKTFESRHSQREAVIIINAHEEFSPPQAGIGDRKKTHLKRGP